MEGKAMYDDFEDFEDGDFDAEPMAMSLRMDRT